MGVLLSGEEGGGGEEAGERFDDAVAVGREVSHVGAEGVTDALKLVAGAGIVFAALAVHREVKVMTDGGADIKIEGVGDAVGGTIGGDELEEFVREFRAEDFGGDGVLDLVEGGEGVAVGSQ
jgi:hypothetical protein